MSACSRLWQTLLVVTLSARLPCVAGDERPAAAFAVPASQAGGVTLHQQKELADVTLLSAAANTTAPPPEDRDDDNTIKNILKDVGFFINKEIRSARQWAVALAAFVMGLVLVINGKGFYQGLIIFCMGVVASVMAMNLISELWHLQNYDILRLIVGLEVGLAVLYASWKGIDGLNISVGVGFGFYLAYKIQGAMVTLGMMWISTAGGSHWGVVILYTGCVVALGLLFRNGGHLTPLAIISPVIGGVLIVSSFSWGFTQLVLVWSSLKDCLSTNGVTPVAAHWLKFLELLITIHSPDVGFFAGSKYNIPADTRCNTDRILGWMFWLVVTSIGWYLQYPRHKTAHARSLEQPLLDLEE